MKKLNILLTAAVLAAVLTGCQATPGSPVVIGKDLEQMLKMAESGQNTAGSLKDRLGIPKRYESYVENEKGNFKVTIDADVVLPEADSIRWTLL